MIGYCASLVPRRHLEMFVEATCLVERFPDRQPDGEWVRCHEATRAVWIVLGEGRVVDGEYGCCAQHSWIELDGGILDVYSVARLPVVQYVHVGRFRHAALHEEGDLARGVMPKWGEIYREESSRTDIREEIVDWLVSVSSKAIRRGSPRAAKEKAS